MRRSVFILLSAVVVVAMFIGVWRYVRPLDRPEQLTLTSVEGDVELTGPGRGGVAKAGEPIRPADHLTTEDGRAVLELEGGTRVRIGPGSSVLVLEVDEAGVELELEGGALKATVRPESGSVAVSGAGVTAQATDAEFEIGVREGFAVVQSSRGDVALMGADVGRVASGQRAVIRGRAAAVGPIPDDLLLSVQWPESRRTRASSGEVTGTTAPGARVVIVGQSGRHEVQSGPDGVFSATVPLGEGDNPVRVTAHGLFGEETQVQGVLQTRDTSPPTLRGSVEYDR